MKTNPFCYIIFLCAHLCIGCVESESFVAEKGNSQVDLLPDKKADDVVDARLFEVINLDYPGLEKVKNYYEAGEYYFAANELLKYYRNRGDVENPSINLLNPSISAFDQNVANQALEDRFYVRNFRESIGTDGKEVSYSFKRNEKIDWNYIPEEIKDQEFRYQLHRHQWMLPQAKAYRVTGDEKYVDSWMSVYADWLAAFPCPKGSVTSDTPAWHGLQPAERTIAQIDMLPYFIQSSHVTPEYLSMFLTALADAVECIRRNYFTDGSNIYVTQVQAVFTAGILMPEFKNASTWLSEGTERIEQQTKAQFLSDGVQVELDPSYHLGVIADLYKVYQLAQSNDKLSIFPSDYKDRLHKAARFMMDVVYPNYTIDNFNDTRSSSLTKSVLLRNFITYMKMFPEDKEMAWIATEGKQGTQPVSLTQLYDASGYYMLRSGWTSDATMMILKNNKNKGNKWHCQPDNGTFGLYRKGRNFCPDAGVYSYGGSSASNADRTAFAATSQHNTMTLNKKDIAKGYMNGELVQHKKDGNTEVLVRQNRS